MRGFSRSVAVTAAVVAFMGAAAWAASPPQRIPSAVLVYPLIEVEGGGATVDTRVELVNLSNRTQRVKCIYVSERTCSPIDFFVTLTANQPLSWLASRGTFNTTTFTAVPPFSNTGELKCIVIPAEEAIEAHNAIQGRAAVFGADGQTIGYSAIGFQRLTDGELTNLVELDGATYTQCPDEQHFVILASDPDVVAEQSELVLAPCAEDIENLIPTTTTVQFLVVNEFEETLSASTTVTCFARRPLAAINRIFTGATLGSETAHLTVKGVQSPILSLVVDRFLTSEGVPATAGNQPALRGGRSAVIRLP